MAVWAQSEDVFTWRNGLVVPGSNSEFIKGEEIIASDEYPIYVWGSERVSSPNIDEMGIWSLLDSGTPDATGKRATYLSASPA